ncbi:hypothetical protein RI129_006638 [Pyrocoelia pectoralis]|uniref:Uncharacterized protein n=1 Tax=Pyrocoelia pectoralis TaxID=417401 RepID=A0AAN7ZP12_9COLE
MHIKMQRSMDATFNLKRDNLELKKELAAVRNENHLLTVKARKLVSEINKKDKQIEILVDPCKSTLIKKVLSEKGASMIITLRNRIQKLEKILTEKDCTIRRLQSDLQTKKLYTIKSGERKRCGSTSSKYTSIPFTDSCFINEPPVVDFFEPLQNDTDKQFTKKSGRSLSASRLESKKNDTRQNDQYEDLSRSDLLSIIDNLKLNQRATLERNSAESPHSDLDGYELQCDTPHPEIQQLQNYFMDILGEVEHLKVTIANLRNDQEKTVTTLKEKDSNIEDLANEILHRPSVENSAVKRSTKVCTSNNLVEKSDDFSYKRSVENLFL